jgi:hypothetical protein
VPPIEVEAEARLAALRERRRQRRERVRRHRRTALAAGAVALAAAVALLSLAVGGGGGDGGGSPGGAQAPAGRATDPRPAQLPGGGRAILPRRRVVAYYGAPQSPALGALGATPLPVAARRLRQQARPYNRPGRPVLLAFELIATVASSTPGDHGRYSYRQPPGVIRRYLRAARRAGAILVLDVQPGRSEFMDEVRALEPFLREPDVSLALDPEWKMVAPEVPGQTIGSTDAEVVNAVSARLARLVRERRLPQKLLLVHQFTESMIERKQRLRANEGVALVLNVDGFGDRANKVSKYRQLTGGSAASTPPRTAGEAIAAAAPRSAQRGRYHGFKLFYEEDTGLMTPADVLRLRPQPDVVIYE